MGTLAHAGLPTGSSPPTRILFLIDELDVGGTEQQLLELTKRLDHERFAPLVCCFRPGRISREIEAAGVPVVVLAKRVKLDPLLIWRLIRLMHRERIEVLQTYLFTANTWGRLAGILAGVPVIVSSERNVDVWGPLYKRLFGRWLDRWTRVTIANSRAVKDYLVGKGLPGAKIRVIHNGVDPERFTGPETPHATRAELGIPPHHAVVGFLARLELQKDPHTFLQAAAIIAQQLPGVSFLVAGGGSLEAELRQHALTLGLGARVVFTGARRDIARLLAACDVSAISSLKEGMSNTIMESMAAGKPMVATRVGGNAELIEDGVTGLLVPRRDPAALAAAIQRLLEDPALAKSMGAHGRARIGQRFSVDAMARATQRLYDELAQGLARPATGAAGPARAEDGRTIALVVSQFPRYVDAYFLREIAGLAARGVRFRIFSLRRFGGTVIHETARPLMEQTLYPPFLLSWPLLRAHMRFLARMPGRYLGILATVIAGSLRHPRSLLRVLAVLPKSVYMAELVREQGIAHIHANWGSHPAASALVMSTLSGVPWSFAGHASDIHVERAMPTQKIRLASFVVTCTRHNREYLARVGGPGAAEKIVVSYHGVDLPRFVPMPERRAGAFRILAVGSLRECKGLPDLIEAGRILARRGLAFECAIVGDGPDRRSLERLIHRAGLGDRIRITGYVSQETLIPMYQEASLVVLPALSESHFGIPNVLLEALAVGTPVICTPLPSLSEVIEDGVHGFYVPEHDPAALADAIERLARDPARCRAMGEAGRLQIERLFGAEKNTATPEALFSGAAPGSSRPSAAPAATHATSRMSDR